jgi:hypothetical protein
MNKNFSEKKLLELIDNKRKEMVEAVKVFGLENEKSIKISQELDQLIIKYQKLPCD